MTYVDLYLIHSPNGDIPAVWRELERAQADGLTKSIGVSNFAVDHLEKLENAKVKPAVNQVRTSYRTRDVSLEQFLSETLNVIALI